MARNKPAQNDAAFEIVFYENILQRSPGFIEALVALAELYTKEGLYEKGLALDLRLAALRPEDPVVQYNLACSLSLTGDVPGSFAAFRRAIDQGYEDLAHLEKDQDLVNLFTDPGFQDYYRALKQGQG